MQIVDKPLDNIARQIRSYVKGLEEIQVHGVPRLNIEYTADNSIREKRGAVDQTYFYQFADERIDIIPSPTKSAVRLDLLRESLLGHLDRRVIIDEQECPLLIRALKAAKWRFANGIKTDTLEFDPNLYPLQAFECAIELALSEKETTGY